jgi:hypothetical protein
MLIGADEALADVEAPVAALLELVVVLGLLLLPLVHAARTPTESATAPNATAFLENQGRGALTPGSSFLNRSCFSVGKRARRMLRVLTFRGYTGGLVPPCDKHGDLILS